MYKTGKLIIKLWANNPILFQYIELHTRSQIKKEKGIGTAPTDPGIIH